MDNDPLREIRLSPEAERREEERRKFFTLQKRVEELEAHSKPSFADIVVEHREKDVFLALQKQVEELTARVKKLEDEKPK